MKKVLSLLSISTILCICLVGCKSDDYKQAVSFQESGDYTAAMEIFESLDGYKDSADRIVACSAMIDALNEYDAASTALEEKNTALDNTISEAEAFVFEGKPALDGTLAPALETAISEAKAARKTMPEAPGTVDEIHTVITEYSTVDYTDALVNIAAKKSDLERSIAQYALVDAPDESYIIQCLENVPNVTGISAATEENDPNGQLNKSGGYTAQVYFSSDLVDPSELYGSTIMENGTAGGGSIEVYATVEDAERRVEYLASFDGSFLATGSHTVIGTVIVRTSNLLTASQQKEMESNIIAILTAID